jgi:preprotein translocase subunit SecG
MLLIIIIIIAVIVIIVVVAVVLKKKKAQESSAASHSAVSFENPMVRGMPSLNTLSNSLISRTVCALPAVPPHAAQ